MEAQLKILMTINSQIMILSASITEILSIKIIKLPISRTWTIAIVRRRRKYLNNKITLLKNQRRVNQHQESKS